MTRTLSADTNPSPMQVQNPEKFMFKPKELLSLTSDIFLTLSVSTLNPKPSTLNP
jgi:hypothetical protein